MVDTILRIELPFCVKNCVKLVLGNCWSRQSNASATSCPPCYIETIFARFQPIRFIIRPFAFEKIERDLVRKKKLKFWQTFAPNRIRIQWFLEFTFWIEFGRVCRFRKSILTVNLDIKENLLFLAYKIFQFSLHFLQFLITTTWSTVTFVNLQKIQEN